MSSREIEAVEGNYLDTVKLIIALLCLVASVTAFYVFSEESTLLRVSGLLAGAIIAVVIAMRTEKGHNIWRFFQGAQVEVRKVVWPTREETAQTTLIVVLVVILIAIILWLLDIFLGWSVGALMGHRGS